MTADGTVIVADLEAGIGTLTRLAEAAVDVAVVVVEPTPRSMDVARRALAVAVEQRQGRVILVANKVRDEHDRMRVESAFPGQAMVVVPEDPSVEDADRLGVSPMDHGPRSPAVTALESLADRIVEISGIQSASLY